jgi:hypothetical protein
MGRKSVRFDTFRTEAVQVASEAADMSSDSSRILRDSAIQTEPEPARAIGKADDNIKLEEPFIPNPSHREASLSRPKSPGVRVVDAFGREQPQVNTRGTVETPHRNKSAVRIVDAMGREVESLTEEVTLPKPMQREEVFNLVRNGLSELSKGLEEAERYVVIRYPGIRLTVASQVRVTTDAITVLGWPN